MADLVVYMNDEGGMSIMIPSSNVFVPNIEGTPTRDSFVTFNNSEEHDGYREATIQEIAARDIPEGIEWHVIDSADVPQDRYFRNAWKHESGNVSVDMEKAIDIHKNVLRERRAPLLAALDIDFMRAVEQANTTDQSTISARKQQLRDITSHSEITASTTLEELKVAALSVLA